MPSSILTWNRLELQPKTNDLSVALRCEIRDALWMLARQWQMGEFRAEDAGACAFVKVQCESTFAQKLSLRGGEPETCSPEIPLNFLTEGIPPLESHPPAEGMPPSLSLDLCVELGRYWLKLLRSKLPTAKGNTVIKKFKENPLLHFKMPVTETPEEQVLHAATLNNLPYVQMLSALGGGRALDGWRLFQQLQTQKASNFLPQSDGAVDQLGEDFKKWVLDTFPSLVQNAQTGWDASRLEYQFDCAASKGTEAPTVLRVAEHDGSFLDWHSFEQGNEGATPLHPDLLQSVPMPAAAPLRRTATLLPRSVTFPGAPSNRWWEMEDSSIDLANLRPSASDPSQLVLAEFAMLFSNDWLSIPLDLPVGSLNKISTLLVTDVFGHVTRVAPTPQNEAWGLFSVAGKMASSLWLPPSSSFVTQGPAKEEVLLLRDEMANLAWGIENIVPDGLGGGMDGLEAATSLRLWFEQLPGTSPEPVATVFADRQYLLGTSVPENWIPFVPVRFNQAGQMNLRRAALPRTIAGRPPVRIRPRTQLLRPGLSSPDVQPFDLNEEEITMPGILVRQYWRQARWFDGKIFTWLAREKRYARPTQGAGLRFDTMQGEEKVG